MCATGMGYLWYKDTNMWNGTGKLYLFTRIKNSIVMMKKG